ncbi:hypothetical protein Psi02_72200 [Planotetraspora silvatica]|uniref:Uncharacterized protein n=1 Tax=Planotetraspora silvatica TaxID=234614 RepID=A0A8J3XSR9_9ACTN|nr:hypothetical protein Psi02_72200 [Planotetraspora silvatica]
MMDEPRPNHVSEEAREDLQELALYLVRLVGSPSMHKVLLSASLSREDYGVFMHTLRLASYLIGQLWNWFGTYLPDMFMFEGVSPYYCPHCGKQAWPRYPGAGFPNASLN